MNQHLVFARWSFNLALLAAIVTVLAVLGHRSEIIDFRPALFGLAGGALIGLLAILLGVVGIIITLMGKQSGGGLSLAGLFVGLIVATPVFLTIQAGSKVPQIHDISTDLQDPPKFTAVQALRNPTHNSLDREEPTNLAALQQAGYPDLDAELIREHPDQVFKKAVALIKTRGWETVAISAKDGTIEATDTTPIMGFKDDIVIRIRGEEGKSVVDMRSASRVGKSDMGVNAARIRAFLADLDNAAE